MLDSKIVKVLLAYVAVSGGPLTKDFAARFVGTYQTFPPGCEHQTVVICNGGPLTREQGLMFPPMNCVFYPRSNEGWDIGGYQEIASVFKSDLMVCCGESVYFHRRGWLAQLAAAWNKFGPGMYGSFSSNLVRGHLNTTGFACDPKFLANYPKVRTRAERYDCEHGQKALWRRIASLGGAVKLVTWDGAWDPLQWRNPANILWRGDQSNCLMFCKHTERYAQANAETKRKWARGADQPFR